MDSVELNRVFHDHECHYYDERFAIVHDARSARRARREVETLLQRAIATGDIIVDVGCGTGWLAAGLARSVPSATVIGLDLSAGMLDRARAAGAWPLVQGEGGGGMRSIPIRSQSVDLVIGRGVLHHLPDPAGALAEWRRVLKPGGSVVLSSEPTPVVGRHGEVVVKALLSVLREPLSDEAHMWEMAAMAANLHVFTDREIAALAVGAGFSEVNLRTSAWAATMVLTASYVVHGRSAGVARRVPWRHLESAARTVDAAVFDRLLPQRSLHTVVGRLVR